MEIKHFSKDRIDEVAAMAAEVWGKEQGASTPEVARIFCRHLARYSTYTTKLSLQATDEDGLQAIAFPVFR